MRKILLLFLLILSGFAMPGLQLYGTEKSGSITYEQLNPPYCQNSSPAYNVPADSKITVSWTLTMNQDAYDSSNGHVKGGITVISGTNYPYGSCVAEEYYETAGEHSGTWSGTVRANSFVYINGGFSTPSSTACS